MKWEEPLNVFRNSDIPMLERDITKEHFYNILKDASQLFTIAYRLAEMEEMFDECSMEVAKLWGEIGRSKAFNKWVEK